jgi:hypothetical protein
MRRSGLGFWKGLANLQKSGGRRAGVNLKTITVETEESNILYNIWS